MARSNTCELVVGRLIEITVDAGYHVPADVDAMIAMIGAAMARIPASTKAVIVADWRGVHLMPPDTATRAHAMLTAVSPRGAIGSRRIFMAKIAGMRVTYIHAQITPDHTTSAITGPSMACAFICRAAS